MRKRMNPQVYKMLMELDRRDFNSQNYFEWSEIEKTRLTSDIVRFFIPFVRHNKEHLMIGLHSGIEEALSYEDYEQADILTRCLKSIEKMKV